MKFLFYKILSFFLISSTIIANNFSLSFDGQNDYVDLGQNLLSGTGDFSISLWANSSSNSNDQILIQKRDANGFNGEYLLLLQSNGTIKIWTYRNGYKWTVVSPETYNDGEWHHIVVVQDNSINGGRLYVDGIEIGSSSNGVVNLMGPLRTYLGADMRDSILYLNGFIDNVMIYSDVLTNEEIELLYNNDNTLNDNIVGYWNCNTGSGDILYDQSGNANNGTISGALWSTNTAAKSIYVSTIGSDENGDGSEEDPYSTIQKGIDAASEGDTVFVGSGTYFENIGIMQKGVVLIGQNAQTTIIDGGGNNRTVEIGDWGDLMAEFTKIKNFTITNGNGYIAGGLEIYNVDAFLENVIVKNNIGEDGGAIAASSCTVDLKNVVIVDNIAEDCGGAFDLYPNVILNVSHSTILNNVSQLDGFGSSDDCGSAFGSNETDLIRGYSEGTELSFVNCIIWGHEQEFISESDVFSYSIIEDGAPGESNLNTNPLLIDITNGDYRLSDYSPAIGAGTFNDAPATDIEENPRPHPAGSNPDMGVYENSLGTPEDVIYGDVTMNGTVSSFDASLILRHVVGLDTLSYLQQLFGDVSQNNELLSLDASYILQYVVGLIDELPYTPDNLLANGEFIMEDITASIGETISIPIRIINDSNIHSFSGALNYNHEILLLDTITIGNYYSNSILISNKREEGDVYFASSGFTPNEGFDEIAIVIFTVLDGFNGHTTVSITDLELNENNAIESTSSMSINGTMNIDKQLPTIYTLYQNYPNPFNPSTEIRYSLKNSEPITITIYDIIGNRIKLLVNERKSIGHHTVEWDATNTAGESVSAGMYFYTIEAGSFKQTKKMIHLK